MLVVGILKSLYCLECWSLNLHIELCHIVVLMWLACSPRGPIRKLLEIDKEAVDEITLLERSDHTTTDLIQTELEWDPLISSVQLR